MADSKLNRVMFKKGWGIYNRGDIAGFTDDMVKKLKTAKVICSDQEAGAIMKKRAQDVESNKPAQADDKANGKKS
ncbi:MAG: hypothetical protein JKY31_13470 [Rhodobacteraceae bacterium]|nr:hypothetical protein [Paracoccaceae bacterium]